MTMFDPRTKLSEQVVDEVRRFFGELVYDVIIPRTVRLSEAPGFGQPITVYDPKSKGAETYRELAREVAVRPAPTGPMPIYDELPSVVVPPVEATILPPEEDELEADEDPPTTVTPQVEVHPVAASRGRAFGRSPPPPPEPPDAPEPAPAPTVPEPELERGQSRRRSPPPARLPGREPARPRPPPTRRRSPRGRRGDEVWDETEPGAEGTRTERSRSTRAPSRTARRGDRRADRAELHVADPVPSRTRHAER